MKRRAAGPSEECEDQPRRKAASASADPPRRSKRLSLQVTKVTKTSSESVKSIAYTNQTKLDPPTPPPVKPEPEEDVLHHKMTKQAQLTQSKEVPVQVKQEPNDEVMQSTPKPKKTNGSLAKAVANSPMPIISPRVTPKRRVVSSSHVRNLNIFNPDYNIFSDPYYINTPRDEKSKFVNEFRERQRMVDDFCTCVEEAREKDASAEWRKRRLDGGCYEDDCFDAPHFFPALSLDEKIVAMELHTEKMMNTSASYRRSVEKRKKEEAVEQALLQPKKEDDGVLQPKWAVSRPAPATLSTSSKANTTPMVNGRKNVTTPRRLLPVPPLNINSPLTKGDVVVSDEWIGNHPLRMFDVAVDLSNPTVLLCAGRVVRKELYPKAAYDAKLRSALAESREEESIRASIKKAKEKAAARWSMTAARTAAAVDKADEMENVSPPAALAPLPAAPLPPLAGQKYLSNDSPSQPLLEALTPHKVLIRQNDGSLKPTHITPMRIVRRSEVRPAPAVDGDKSAEKEHEMKAA